MHVASPLVRQWVLLRTLCARHYGASVKELADELAVNGPTRGRRQKGGEAARRRIGT